MVSKPFPVIDPVATGENISRLRRERGLSVRDLQAYFGFEEPQAIYKWQKGRSLPTVDNLYALGALLGVPMEEILVPVPVSTEPIPFEQQAEVCCSFVLFYSIVPSSPLSVIEPLVQCAVWRILIEYRYSLILSVPLSATVHLLHPDSFFPFLPERK